MALTDLIVKKAQPKTKFYKMGDGGGLWLRVNPNGSKIWHYRYKLFGKESAISLGHYPTIGLKEARGKSLEAKRLLAQRINPATQRKEQVRLARFNADNSFRAVAEDWHTNTLNKWSSDHGKRIWRRLEMHILPALGSRAIAEISTLELLDILRKIEASDKIETTHRLLQTCRQIFRFAVLGQKIAFNPASDLQGILKTHKTVNYPTIGHNQIPEFLNRLQSVKTSDLNRLAIKLLMLTFLRQGELRRIKWTDLDFNAMSLRIRPETTKMRALHHVPLSAQAVDILLCIKRITGFSEYVFASQQNRRHPFMSENTVNKVLHNMGYKGLLVGHGFRSMASTILNENGFRADVIERQLAHMPRDRVRAAYNRAEYLQERRQMMQWWGDFLKQLGLD